MTIISAVVLCSLVLGGPGAVSALGIQQPPSTSATADEIDRLLGLARVWGQVKYFHPALGHRPDIDWDSALVAAIRRVRTATFSLPGGITDGFTGQAVTHADGRQLQRIGLQPDIEIRPTINGIRAGIDEVLEAAMRYLHRYR